MENEPIEVTLIVTGVFEKLDVPYLIGGSLASTLYGMVRTTQDSDIIAEMHHAPHRLAIAVSMVMLMLREPTRRSQLPTFGSIEVIMPKG